MIDSQDITGLVLAGGRGTRMAGVDKGLQAYRGLPLALHALQRLSPQVGPTMISANRNLDAYEAMGAPVWQDELPDFPGPLAGVLTGLSHCETRYLVTVPCDSPLFPADLVARLAKALDAEGAEIAMAVTPNVEDELASVQRHPVFCLMNRDLVDSLGEYTQSGQRKVEKWAARHRLVEVLFDDAAAFANANTLDELARLPQHHG
jgi:molybdopterin-guanine dinucleotide biosynthesis protein A